MKTGKMLVGTEAVFTGKYITLIIPFSPFYSMVEGFHSKKLILFTTNLLNPFD